MAVGEVIRNRMRLRYNSDGTMAGTVMRAYQFSGMNTEDPNRVPAFNLDDQDPLVQDCKHAWEQSQWTDYSNGAVLYLNLDAVKSIPAWVPKCRVVAKIGGHTFYLEQK